MTRIAIITDIHAELDRLKLVLADIQQRGCERILCLGDSVDERPGGAPVLTTLLSLGVPSVMGNCDQLCDLAPGSLEKAFVDSMPRTISIGDATFTHISPIVGSRGIRTVTDAQQAFAGSRQRLAFVGHVHAAQVFSIGPSPHDSAAQASFEYGQLIPFKPAMRYIVTVGPVGHGRDGIREPRYAIWDQERDGLVMVRLGS